MTKERGRAGEPEELGRDELEELEGQELPDRQAMSLIDTNVAIPIDPAVAANVLADESIAGAEAEQDANVDQEGGKDDGDE